MAEIRATNNIIKDKGYRGEIFITQEGTVYAYVRVACPTQDALKAIANTLAEAAVSPQGRLEQNAEGQLRGPLFAANPTTLEIGFLEVWAAGEAPLRGISAALTQYVVQLPPEIVKATLVG